MASTGPSAVYLQFDLLDFFQNTMHEHITISVKMGSRYANKIRINWQFSWDETQQHFQGNNSEGVRSTAYIDGQVIGVGIPVGVKLPAKLNVER